MHEEKNSRPTIFLIEEDNNAQPSLTRRLRERGYRVLVSASLEDSFEWTNGTSHIHADLVLVDLLSKPPEEALSIARHLREHCKYDQNTPVSYCLKRLRRIWQVLIKKLPIVNGYVFSLTPINYYGFSHAC